MRIVFVSTMMGARWGGSEDLWSRAAIRLAAEGASVSASTHEWSPLHPRVLDLAKHGVDLWVRPRWHSFAKHPWRRLKSRRTSPLLVEVERLLAARLPTLAVLSDGGVLPPIELIELCVAKAVPFVTVSNSSPGHTWFSDDIAERYRVALPHSVRCFFMCQSNVRHTEKLVGCELSNAQAICSSFNIDFNTSVAWPAFDEIEGVRFACVGSLHPPSKGQDLLLEALARPPWPSRPWRLTFYGDGEMRNGIERLVGKLGLSHRVAFGGYAKVEEIWAANHVLVSPSRYEGLAMVVVQAMLCGRPVIATDVGGHAEVVDHGVTGFLAEGPTVASIGRALEQFWERRGEAQEIGRAAAHRIRELVPPDPVQVFSEQLKALAGSAVGSPEMAR